MAEALPASHSPLAHASRRGVPTTHSVCLRVWCMAQVFPRPCRFAVVPVWLVAPQVLRVPLARIPYAIPGPAPVPVGTPLGGMAAQYLEGSRQQFGEASVRRSAS